jgi:simple sugar transport system ATP-binding protein
MLTPILRASNICKNFGPIEALKGIDFEVNSGEIVALVGDNGAGKSTLTKVLVGAYSCDEGIIEFENRPVAFADPGEARRAGLEMVFQDLALAPDLEPAENFFLGRELCRGGALGQWLGWLNRPAMRAEMHQVLSSLGVSLAHTMSRVGDLSGGQQQGIAVARAAHWASKVLFLDEPTAALGVKQRRGVLDLVHRVSEKGLGVVLISHDLPEVIEIAHRIHVLRRGRTANVFKRGEVDTTRLVASITGSY